MPVWACSFVCRHAQIYTYDTHVNVHARVHVYIKGQSLLKPIKLHFDIHTELKRSGERNAQKLSAMK